MAKSQHARRCLNQILRNPGRTARLFAGIKIEKEANDLQAFISQCDKDGKTK